MWLLFLCSGSETVGTRTWEPWSGLITVNASVWLDLLAEKGMFCPVGPVNVLYPGLIFVTALVWGGIVSWAWQWRLIWGARAFISPAESRKCHWASQDGVPVETRRARAPADLAAPEGVPVSRHQHAEIRPTSILLDRTRFSFSVTSSDLLTTRVTILDAQPTASSYC